ncbi:MAG: glutamine-hydrolyzing GMP synthase [Patescibacteria group bacterium]
MSQVLIIDFGAQYAQLIARRVRELGFSAELISFTAPLETLRRARAFILSGGPASVYTLGAPRIRREVCDLGIPILGICYGQQLACHLMGGKVKKMREREYGPARLNIIRASPITAGMPKHMRVWMSHGDAVVRLPKGSHAYGLTAHSPFALVGDKERKIWGVQFHPEVTHTAYGMKLLNNFLTRIADLKKDWSMPSFVKGAVDEMKEKVGKGYAIAALSGGIDSAVATALVHRAIGHRLIAMFINHGLLRAGEEAQVEETMRRVLQADLRVVRAQALFLRRLKGVSDPEEKRKIIGRTFIEVFQKEASRLKPKPNFLVQGTLYPDVIESAMAGSGKTASTIKTHHNVGGLPETMQLKLIEPLRMLFKDEVREVGRLLGLPSEVVARQPFPGPGLAVRIIGEVSEERLQILKHADAIVRDILDPLAKKLKLWQYYAAFLPEVRSVGVQGDERTYAHPVVVRAVTSEDAMTADWARIPENVLARISMRITNEVRGINRVLYDLTSKPPGTVEWE